MKNQGRVIRLRYPGTCSVCRKALSMGTKAHWNGATRTVTCVICHPSPAASPRRFVAGQSAQRTADRRRAREQSDWRNAGWLKKTFIVLQGKQTSARSWERGAHGERVVGARLDELERSGLIVALHDIRIPGSSANVDHVAVAPSGIHIIDAKNYKNAQIEVVDRGGIFRTDVQLRVAKRDRTNLVEKLAKQILTVDAAVRDVPLPTPVTPVLCFVDALWGIFKKQYKINGVHVVPPRRLERLLRRSGPLTTQQVRQVGDVLRQRLRPA